MRGPARFRTVASHDAESRPCLSDRLQHRKQIADLEKIVGSLIVLRDRNRLYLTPVGLRFTKLALMVLAQIERAALDIGGLAAGILRNRSCNTLCYSMANY